MKYLIAVVMLFSGLVAQDRLVTNNGKEYTGNYVGTTDNVIQFIQDGTEHIAGVPKSQVSKVILADGTVVFDQRKMPIHAPADQSQPIIATGTVPAAEIETYNDDVRRQTVALEKIATAQTFFMYYAIAIIALTLIFTASASAG